MTFLGQRHYLGIPTAREDKSWLLQSKEGAQVRLPKVHFCGAAVIFIIGFERSADTIWVQAGHGFHGLQKRQNVTVLSIHHSRTTITDLQKDAQALYLAVLIIQFADEVLHLQGLLPGPLLLGVHRLLGGLLLSFLRRSVTV